MAHVLVVHESESVRSELSRELQGEGLHVTEAESSVAAVRELWQGTFDAVLVGDKLGKMNGVPLDVHLRSLAPEIVTVPISKEPPARLARRVVAILDGQAAA